VQASNSSFDDFGNCDCFIDGAANGLEHHLMNALFLE